jgi:hypothetical protein
MKKFLVLAIALIFLMVLVGCGKIENDKDSNSTKNNNDVIGTWSGNYSYMVGNFPPSYINGVATLDIANGTWVLVFQNISNLWTDSRNGTWTRSGNILSLNTIYYDPSNTVTFSGNTAVLKQNFWLNLPSTVNLTKTSINTEETSLRIKNESSVKLTSVLWQNVYFPSNQADISPGTNVIKNVKEGTGYIFFSINSTAYRTKDIVVIEKNENKEFTFNNYTLVVDLINSDETKILGNL